jgi:predicted aspartyl protease
MRIRARLLVSIALATLLAYPLMGKEKLGGTDGNAFIPFEYAAPMSLVLVPVYLNGSGPYQFLLDTGATHTVLASRVAKKLKLSDGRMERLITAGGAIPVSIGSLEELRIGQIRIPKAQVAVADLALLGNLNVDGILGADYLQWFSVVIDYRKHRIRFDTQSDN